MTGLVPTIPPALVFDGNTIRAAVPVRGPGQWRDLADAANWLLGRGNSLIVAGPSTGETVDEVDESVSAVFRYYIWPSAHIVSRLWCIGLANYDVGAKHGRGTFEIPVGTTVATWEIDDSTPLLQPKMFLFQQAVSSPSDDPGEITIKIRRSEGTSSVIVTSIACYEIPRVRLGDFDTFGTPEETSLESNKLIFDDEDTLTHSVNSVEIATMEVRNRARRAGMFSWFYGPGITSTATSFTGTSNIFAVDIPVLARQLYSGETTRELAYAVYATVNGGSPDGRTKVTESTNSTSDNLTWTTNVAAWRTGVITVDSEDVSALATTAGIPGGTRCLLTVESRKVTGTSITVYGFCVGEALS